MNNFFKHPLRQSAFSIFLFSVCCLSGTLLCIPQAFAQLSGTYTIGGAGGDYANFSEAADALESGGVSSAVTFKVRPGTYEEQLSINAIPGSSCNAPVIFEGDAAAPGQVILQAPDEAGFALQLNGTDGIGFRNMSIVKDIMVSPGSDCFKLEDNIIVGAVKSRSSASERNHEHVYRNNVFQSGSIEVVNEAPWNPDAPVFDEGLVIEGNEFRPVGTILVEGQSDFIISNNILPELRQEADGLTILNSWYGQEIDGNSISVTTGNYKGTAMLLNSVAAASISRNIIRATEGGVGMRFITGKSQGNEILMANNKIEVSGYDARGHNYFPISNLVGLDITNNRENTVKLIHNTIRVSGYTEYVPNYTLSLDGRNHSFHLLNNDIMNGSYGSLIGTGNAYAIEIMDYNNLFKYDDNNFLASWQSSTGFDEHSVSVNSSSSEEPVDELIGAGIYVAAVSRDIKGRLRNDPPTIGAVEGGLPATTLSGTYTIGGESPDFEDFSAAASAMESLGVTGDIVFKVRPGEYTEQLRIEGFSSPETSVTFEGENGDSTAVVLHYPFDDALILEEVSNVTFRHISFGSGVGIYRSSDLLFEGNVMSGVRAFTVNSDIYRNNHFEEGGISKSGEGVREQAGNLFFNSDKNVVIRDNVFEVKGSAISLFAQDSVLISHNKITIDDEDGAGSATAIEVRNGENLIGINHNSIVSRQSNTTGISIKGDYFAGVMPETISYNSIGLLKGGTGMSFDFNSSSGAGGGLVANNMISIYAGNGSKGIAVTSYTLGVQLFHNSINLYGNDSSSRALYFNLEFEEPVSIDVTNNILANQAGGYALYGSFSGEGGNIASSDYNVLYTSGDSLVYWKENFAKDLSAWQSLSRFDDNSLAVDPRFVSAENLTSENPALAGAGMAVNGVQDDFYGEQRAYPPAIGAVEKIQDNQGPVVEAGRDKTLTLPENTISLSGIARSSNSRFVAFRWEKVSGPAVTMAGERTANVQLSDLVEGTYVFRFTATDNKGAVATDEMTLTVMPGEQSNQPPVVSAGSDKVIMLPDNTISLSGTGRDPDGRFTAFLWEKVSGPAVTMAGERTANVRLSDLVEGTYVFRFTATDNEGAKGSDEMTLTVMPGEQSNQPPVVSAGSDKVIMLPVNSISLSGTGRDPDGRFTAFRWEKVSGPAVAMAGERTANVRLSDLVEGTYVFRFTATDNEGAKGSDEMTLTVRAGQQLAGSEVNRISVSAYPNTFRDYVNVQIQAEEQEQYELRVYDLMGREYYQNTFVHDHFNGGLHRIDLSGVNLQEGVYLILIEDQANGIRETVKIVKK